MPNPTLTGCAGAVLLGAFAAAAIALSYTQAHYNDHTAECTITGTDRGGEDGTYRVYTEQCGTLSNVDSLWHWKWNSADLQGQLAEGDTYTLRIVGWRNGLTSTFPNLIEIQ